MSKQIKIEESLNRFRSNYYYFEVVAENLTDREWSIIRASLTNIRYIMNPKIRAEIRRRKKEGVKNEG